MKVIVRTFQGNPEIQDDPMVKLGREARESSLDAHGELVIPTIAFEFIRTMLYETEDERYESLKLEEITEPTFPFLVGYFGTFSPSTVPEP
jgi:hypothetical protein